MTQHLPAAFTLKRVQEMLGVSRQVIVGLVSAGFVTPARGPRNEHQFSFQDLMLLRTAKALQAAKIPPRKIVSSLSRLRAALPVAMPMTGLRITAVGSTVTVRDLTGPREAETGQLLIDFEVAEVGGTIAVTVIEPAAEPTTPRAWLDRGETLEPRDPAAAERAYRRALELAPGYIDAYLNLGALLGERGRPGEAVALYETASGRCPPSALLRFNHAIALEDDGQDRAAIDTYEQALALDPTLADAHFNVARIEERLGDLQSALKHFNAFRRLAR